MSGVDWRRIESIIGPPPGVPPRVAQVGIQKDYPFEACVEDDHSMCPQSVGQRYIRLRCTCECHGTLY